MKRNICLSVILLLLLSLVLLSLTACEEKECEHSYQGTVTKAATCEEEGIKTFTCSLCDDSYIESIPALGHDEDLNPGKFATCTEIGWDNYVTCKREGCTYTTYSEKAAFGHTEVMDEAVAPTCSQSGLTEGKHCSVCNTVLVEQKTVEKLDHEYSEELIYNATHHYHECECGSRKDEEKHISSGAATPTQDEVCTVCGYVINKAVGIKFNTLTVNGNNVYGKVSSDTEIFSFITEVTAVGDAKYVVSTDIGGKDEIPAKTIPLTVGDNTVYITEYVNDEPVAIYKVVIRRRPVYTVTFDANGGTAVDAQNIEEDSFAKSPTTVTREGYTFTGWDYDFGAPIMSDTHITASWKANTDTKYTVEYYLENLDKSEYELIDTDEFTGTTDTAVEAEIKTFEHFTYNAEKSKVIGNINGNGILVLEVYYDRETHTVSVDSDLGLVIGEGRYKYGESVTLFADPNLGYEFIGWYCGDTLVSSDITCTVTITSDITARFDVSSEMESFEFTSTATTCTITGIKDKTVTEIIVPDYVTAISGGAFSGCSSLVRLTIPFVGCSKSATSASSSTLFGYIFGKLSYTGGVATEQYYSLSSYSSVTYYIPSSLKSVTVTGGNILCGAFYNCSSLTSAVIGNTVTSIGEYAFRGCRSLTSVTIPNSVKSIGYDAFSNCTGLKRVYITDIAKWCRISFDDHNANPLYYAHNLYLNGELVTELIIPDSVTSIGSYAFSNCTSLTRVTIGDSVTSIGDDAFAYCSSLTSVYITDIAAWCGISFGDYYANPLYYAGNLYLNGTLVTELIIPDSVTSIGDSAFEGCKSFTSITIPDGVTSIGDDAFAYCSSLTSVYITDIAAWCGISFGDYYANPLYYAGNLYLNRELVSDLVIPDGITKIGSYAFNGCSSLASIIIPDSVTRIGGSAFSGCSNLESLTIPFVGGSKSATSASSSTLFGYIFGTLSYTGGVATEQYYSTSSSSYETYYIPSSLKSVTVTGGNILYGAFAYCTSLTSITIPDGVTSIGNYAFAFCDSLTSVTIGNSVKSIGSYAFENCTSLTSVTIGNSVTSIGNYAFRDCTSLTIYCEAARKPSGWSSTWNYSNRPVVWGYKG